MNIKTQFETTFRGREYWSAVDDDSYDGDPADVVIGTSEQDAIDELKELFEERTEAARLAEKGGGV